MALWVGRNVPPHLVPLVCNPPSSICTLNVVPIWSKVVGPRGLATGSSNIKEEGLYTSFVRKSLPLSATTCIRRYPARFPIPSSSVYVFTTIETQLSKRLVQSAHVTRCDSSHLQINCMLSPTDQLTLSSIPTSNFTSSLSVREN